MNARPLQVFGGPTSFESGSSNGNSILPRYNQRTLSHSGEATKAIIVHPRPRRSRPFENSTNLKQRDLGLSCNGHFIYLCMGGQIYCRLVELDAEEFQNDDAFLQELYRRCQGHWRRIGLLLTMSAPDQVQLKQFHFVSNGPVVRCSRTSSLPPIAHEQYRHHGPDVTCREDMIAHDLKQYGKWQWYGVPSEAVRDRPYADQERTILDAIPKKVPNRLKYLKGHEGWGLHISLRLCYYRLAICLAGWAALSSMSAALLLDLQKASLQDAFVPAGLSLTLFLSYVGLMADLRK